MIWVVMISIACCILLFARLIFMKKEIKNIACQLNDYNNLQSRKKIDVSLFDKEIEELAFSINKHIDVNIQLQIKQKQAEDELKRAIANISHDLRTPLTSIIGYIQMIRTKKISEETQIEYLDIVERRAKSLHTLLSDFFQLSVIESPEYELQVEYVNLNNVLCEVITSFYESFTDKGIEPKINLPKESIIVIGNGTAIKRVIENLLINIVKHSEGDVIINLIKDKDIALLATINYAKNLTKNDVDLIFNRFYSADTSRTNKSGNTGLGLSIAKGLMEKMNGEIYAELHENLLHINCKWRVR